jgi:hypothetical protein
MQGNVKNGAVYIFVCRANNSQQPTATSTSSGTYSQQPTANSQQPTLTLLFPLCLLLCGGGGGGGFVVVCVRFSFLAFFNAQYTYHL